MAFVPLTLLVHTKNYSVCIPSQNNFLKGKSLFLKEVCKLLWVICNIDLSSWNACAFVYSLKSLNSSERWTTLTLFSCF